MWTLQRTLRACEALTEEFSPANKSINRAFFLAGFHYLHGYITKGTAYRTRNA
jgi:hypothetical protein